MGDVSDRSVYYEWTGWNKSAKGRALSQLGLPPWWLTYWAAYWAAYWDSDRLDGL